MFIKTFFYMSKIDTISLSGNTYQISDADLNGFKIVKLTQAEYNALATKDPNTIYYIVG